MAYYQNPYLSQPMQTNYVNQQSNGVNWVQGEAGARSWMLAPNQTVLLMDSETQRFFIKAADASGMPLPLRIFEYKEVSGNQSVNPIAETKYVTKDEFEAFKAELLKGGKKDAELDF